MAVCEKCWAEAFRRSIDDPTKTHAEHYYAILRGKKIPCTPEEQAGPFATDCPICGRKTVNPATRWCTVPACNGVPTNRCILVEIPRKGDNEEIS